MPLNEKQIVMSLIYNFFFILIIIFISLTLLNRESLIYLNIGKRGSGKTLFMTSFAVDWLKHNKSGIVYSNYNLLFDGNYKERFVFTKYCFLPLNSLNYGVLLLIDDLRSLRNIMGLFEVIASASRKVGLTIMMTGQYYTQATRELREYADIRLKTTYSEKTDTLRILYILPSEQITKRKKIRDAVKRFGTLYDTKQIVSTPNMRTLKEEIIKHSACIEDIENNIEMASKNKAEKKELLREILKSEKFKNKF